MLSCLEIGSDKDNKIIFLAICSNTLSHVQNCIAVNTCVNFSKAGKDYKYKLHIEHDTYFYNLMIIDFLNCMCM